MPPTNSARVNCQPIRIQITRPSSQTRLVEANWKASEVTAEAPFWKSDLAIAIAAYEQDDDAAPRPVALASGAKPVPESADSTFSRGTQAWTIAEIAKPRTRAHQTSYAIRKDCLKPSPIVEITSAMVDDYTPWGYAPYMTDKKTPGYKASKDELLTRLARA